MADELEINKGGVVSLIDNHELGEILKPLVREIYLFNSYKMYKIFFEKCRLYIDNGKSEW